LINIDCISPTKKCDNDVTLLVDKMDINPQAQPTWSPDSKQIAFTAWEKSLRQVYKINDDGSGLTQVTHTDSQHWYVTWSPDGKQIAFGSTQMIQVINTEGQVLASFGNDSALHYIYLAWSPDSTHLAFENKERFGYYTSGILAVDGSESFLIRVPNTSEVERFYQDPVWSPDGKRVAFQYKGDIYITNADGSNVIPLTNDPAVFQRNPVWSPDGKLIAFESLIYPSDETAGCLSYFDYEITRLQCDWEIYIMNADGSGQFNLTNDPNWDSSPVWSPDSNYIAFVSARNEHNPDKCYLKSLCNWDIYVMTSDGNAVTKLTDSPGEDIWPVWALSNLQSN
jgi:TolB protein